MIITENYAKQLQKMHNQPKKTIGFGEQPPEKLIEILNNKNYQNILDFGCGKGVITSRLQELFPSKSIYGFDPGVEHFKNYNNNNDLIYSVDALEHIEPEFLDQVLINLFNDSKHQFHLIACHPAKKNLPDGRNCHLIIEQPDWWHKKFLKLFANVSKINYTNSYTKPIKGGRINTYFEIEIEKV